MEKVNALDEKVKALAEKGNGRIQCPDNLCRYSALGFSDLAQVQAERDAAIQRFSTEIRARIPDNSKMKAEKDRMTQERLQRQSGQTGSQIQKQYKFQQAQKAWMSGAAGSPAAPTTSSTLEAASPTSSPPVEASSPTASPAAQAILQTPSPAVEATLPTASPTPE